MAIFGRMLDQIAASLPLLAMTKGADCRLLIARMRTDTDDRSVMAATYPAVTWEKILLRT